MNVVGLRSPLPRRTVLRGLARGAGVAVALPWLEAMAPRRARAQGAVRRFIGGLKPMGMSAHRAHPFGDFTADHFTPKATGANWPMTTVLQPFADLRNDVTILSGVAHRAIETAPTDSICHDGNCVFLVAQDPVEANDGEIFSSQGGGRSMDLLIADRIGAGTRLPSLELQVAYDLQKRWTHFLSWNSAGQQREPMRDASKVFDRVFSAGVPDQGAQNQAALERLRRQRGSVLDGVKANIATLRKQLGVADQARLDRHLGSIREVEQRIASLTAPPTGSGCSAPARPSTSSSFNVVSKAMIDLLVTALACDLTRVATFVIGGGAQDVMYPFLGIPDVYNGIGMSHHSITHGGSDVREWADKIDAWQLEQFAYLIRSLKGAKEGDRTLLDQTVVLVGSETSSGYNHNFGGWAWGGESRPKGSPLDNAFVLAGGTHYFKHGTHVRYKGGTAHHHQVLRACYEAVTGIEGAASASWIPAKYQGPPAPGLRGDRSAEMI